MPKPAAEGYYVTVRRNGSTGWLLGPYPSHDEARGNVDRARDECAEIDPWTRFDAFGTARMRRSDGRPLPEGVLNARIGLHAPERVS